MLCVRKTSSANCCLYSKLSPLAEFGGTPIDRGFATTAKAESRIEADVGVEVEVEVEIETVVDGVDGVGDVDDVDDVDNVDNVEEVAAQVGVATIIEETRGSMV